jgi:hypothetical protein
MHVIRWVYYTINNVPVVFLARQWLVVMVIAVVVVGITVERVVNT